MKNKSNPQRSNTKEKKIIAAKPASKDGKFSKWFIYIALLLTVVAYIPSLSAGFVDWDDPDYVINNLIIQSFSENVVISY